MIKMAKFTPEQLHRQMLEGLKRSRSARRERYAKRRELYGDWRTETDRLAAEKRRYRVAKIGRDHGYNLPSWCSQSQTKKADQYRRIIHRLDIDRMTTEEKQVLRAMMGIKFAHRIAATHTDQDAAITAVTRFIGTV